MPKHWKTIFKMAAVRHLEFAKIALLVTWPISARDSSSPIRISQWSASTAPRYSQKRFPIWRPSTILNLKNFDFFLSNVHPRNGNLHLHTKFDRNRIIRGWHIVINYSKNGGHPPSWICENCRFGHVTFICMWFFISVSNFTLVGQNVAEI